MIVFEGREYAGEPGETVLATLLRAGLELPYSCRKGSCLACLQRAVQGTIPAMARAGLKETLVAEGYFLPCVCLPEGAIVMDRGRDADLFGRATIERVEPLAPDISRVLIRPATPLYYHAGQFLNLRRADGVTRSYSLASVPREDPLLEIHVKRAPGGMMSPWLVDPSRAGEAIDIQGPNGTAFYLPGRPGQPIVLVGTGTGLAPLLGIVRDALGDGHEGPIALYHGSRDVTGHYASSTLRSLAARYGNLSYVPCASGAAEAPDVRHNRTDAALFADHPQLAGFRVFACGLPAMVAGVRRRAYLAGAALADIHGDAFDLRDLRRAPRG